MSDFHFRLILILFLPSPLIAFPSPSLFPFSPSRLSRASTSFPALIQCSHLFSTTSSSFSSTSSSFSSFSSSSASSVKELINFSGPHQATSTQTSSHECQTEEAGMQTSFLDETCKLRARNWRWRKPYFRALRWRLYGSCLLEDLRVGVYHSFFLQFSLLRLPLSLVLILCHYSRLSSSLFPFLIKYYNSCHLLIIIPLFARVLWITVKLRNNGFQGISNSHLL